MAKTYNVGRLSVEMVADTVQYVQKLKAAESTTKKSHKGINDSIDRTSKKSKTGAKNLDKYNNKLSKLGEVATFINGPMGGVASRISSLNSIMGGTGGAVAIVGGLALGMGALTTAALASSLAHAKQYRELKIFADVAGVTVREMQLMSGATETVGISTEKFGDIIKDVQDKIGDFVATGGGEFANVVDVLGDKLGYTATELQNMAGPDALEAVAHAMQQANLPMDQQIFLMESIANDASRLLPLYANMSEELNKQKDATEVLVRAMDEDLLSVYKDLDKATNRLIDNTQDVIADAMSPFAESITELTNAFNFYLASLEEGSKASERYRMAEIRNEMDEIRQSMKDAETATGRFMNVLTFQSTDIGFLRKQLMELSDEYDKLNIKLNTKAEEDTPKPATRDHLSWFDTENFKKAREEALKIQKAREEDEKRIADNRKKRRDAELKAQKEANDKALAEDLEFYEAVNAAREQQMQKESELYELQKMALSGPSSGDNETDFNNELTLLKLNHDRELELLKQQYANKEGLENEYQAAMKASKNQYYADVLNSHQQSVDAEMALYRSVGQGVANQITALAGASEEEKRELTKQFLVKQALAAADATLAYYSTLAAHEAAAASLGVAGAPYLAAQTAIATSNYTRNLAGIGAVTLGGVAAGQFHSGTDSVPSEGSYLLQKGERVIQPKANRDLTDFMSKGGGGGTTSIDASMTIQGNVTDQNWFSEQLVKQREIIAASVAKVERERPRSRRK